jgi:hypothetical protein
MSLRPYVPAPDGDDSLWYPGSAAQQNATDSLAQMLLFGGSAGSLKTNFLINDAVRERDNKNMSSLFLRESYPQLQKNVLPEMRRYYSQMGAYFVEGVKRVWTFPSGARVHVGVIAREADITNFQGNPFSALYVDESGNHPEKHIRDILPWLRSTDPSLFKRVRLGSNPGGVGAAWQLSVFLANHCPVHQPKKSVQPGVIYGGKGKKPSKWHSDGKPIPLTVSFIPGKITDHNLLGDDYQDLLQMQEGERAEQLLKGCWCRLEGAYFSFLRPEYVMPYALVGDEWWWTHFISIDYGYGSSSAAAGFYAVNEAGRIFKIGEIVEKKMGSVDFARKIRDEWILPNDHSPYPNKGGERMRIVCCYMDPANDSETGNGRSNMDLMREVFAEHDLDIVPASKGRVANAQRLLEGLQNAGIVITDLAPRTYKSLTTRMHSEKTSDVRKVHGDPLDDIYDETSYAYNTWIQESDKPKEVARAQRIQEMQKAGMDEHSLTVNRLKMLMESQNDEDEFAPVRITGVGRRHNFGGR